MELECPNASANIDFVTNDLKPLSTSFINLIIVDEDPELTTKDLTLAPPIDYKTYNVDLPINFF
jgi:hypothetical protein